MTDLPTKAITPKDKEDLVFGLQHQVEWIDLFISCQKRK